MIIGTLSLIALQLGSMLPPTFLQGKDVDLEMFACVSDSFQIVI